MKTFEHPSINNFGLYLTLTLQNNVGKHLYFEFPKIYYFSAVREFNFSLAFNTIIPSTPVVMSLNYSYVILNYIEI